MVKLKIRSKTIYIEYYVNKVRYRRSTNLKETPKNIEYVEKTLIPQLSKKIEDGSIYKKKDTSFKYYGEIFLNIKEKKLRTYSQKMSYFLKVIDYFDTKPIEAITRLDIKQFYNSLDMKAKSKGIYRNCVNEVFELAVDDGILNHNPALGIDLGKDEAPEVQFYSKKDVLLLLSSSTGIFNLYLELGFNHGLRPEEILGLQFTDIKGDKLSVKRVRTKKRVDYPKTTNAYRTLKISNNLKTKIEEQKKISKSLYLMGDDKDDISRFRYEWKQLIEKTKVDYKKISCARHTFATHMLRDNVVSINELSGLLGHSSPKVTLQHYASVIKSNNIDLGSDFSLYNELGTVTGTPSNSNSV